LPRLSDSFRTSLDSLATEYQKALTDDARCYLNGRGIDDGAIERYRIGEVTADSEHGWYAGMICLPYLTSNGVVSLKFRQPHACTSECEHQRYITPYRTRLYNTLSMDEADKIGIIAITEGEFDAITLDYHCGIPAVAIPGVDSWQAHPEWKRLFEGYRSVLICTDNDEEGRRLAKRVAVDVNDGHTLTLSSKDANATYLAAGADEIRRKAGLDERA